MNVAQEAVRIPVKWATDSAGKWATDSGDEWARLRIVSRRGKDMMTEVAHLGQAKSENSRRLVSIISFPSSRFLVVGFRRCGPPFR